MALIDAIRPIGIGDTISSRISRASYVAVNAIVDWNDARITRKSLSRLTTRELDDIGLTRGDIDQIVARGGSRF